LCDGDDIYLKKQHKLTKRDLDSIGPKSFKYKGIQKWGKKKWG